MTSIAGLLPHTRQRTTVALALFAVAGPAFAAFAQSASVRISVEFFVDGRCNVTGDGDGFHASVTDQPPPIDVRSELRCAIPSAPRGRSVDLTVAMPIGSSPSHGDFPRLTWAQRGAQWIGTATLPAAPAFVRVPQAGSGADVGARVLDWTALGAVAAAIAWSLRFGVKHG